MAAAARPPAIKEILKFINASKGFDTIMKRVNIISAENGECVAEYKIQEDVTNISRTLHGGFASTLVDAISSYALFSATDCRGYVSVDMQISYLKAPKLGEELRIHGKILRAGRTMSYTSCQITNKNTGELLVNGLHTLFTMQ